MIRRSLVVKSYRGFNRIVSCFCSTARRLYTNFGTPFRFLHTQETLNLLSHMLRDNKRMGVDDLSSTVLHTVSEFTSLIEGHGSLGPLTCLEVVDRVFLICSLEDSRRQDRMLRGGFLESSGSTILTTGQKRACEFFDSIFGASARAREYFLSVLFCEPAWFRPVQKRAFFAKQTSQTASGTKGPLADVFKKRYKLWSWRFLAEESQPVQTARTKQIGLPETLWHVFQTCKVPYDFFVRSPSEAHLSIWQTSALRYGALLGGLRELFNVPVERLVSIITENPQFRTVFSDLLRSEENLAYVISNINEHHAEGSR